MIVKDIEELLKYYNLKEPSLADIWKALEEKYSIVELFLPSLSGLSTGNILLFKDNDSCKYISISNVYPSLLGRGTKLTPSDVKIKLLKKNDKTYIRFYVKILSENSCKTEDFCFQSKEIDNVEERILTNDLGFKETWFGYKKDLDMLENKYAYIKYTKEELKNIIKEINFKNNREII